MKYFAVAGFCALSCAWGQTPPPDGIVSPEVHKDRTVTFRIRAPKAAQVSLYGDWMPVGTTVPMTKSGEGDWSITTAPLEANIHLYTFTVDGVTAADPVNPRVKLRQRTSASLVEVPADPPAPWEVRDVPHGSVDANWVQSKVITGETREIYVYLPPGYEKNSRTRYPVLYLLHGNGDTAFSWTQAGGANLILDNLIAAQKARPMIVVMPLGHAVPFGSPRELAAKNTAVFENYLVGEVMPWAEAKYRIAPGPRNRALAGLSMGGAQTLNVGLAHLDLFGSLGVFSAPGVQDFETKFKRLLDDAKGTNAKLATFWIACGDHDNTVQFPRVKAFSELLHKYKVRHTLRVIEGGAHTWPVWRVCLSEFVPLLFRQS